MINKKPENSRTKDAGNLILIGMPTSGKSTVGVILAKILGMDFVDTDLLIQNRTGQRLEEILSERGIDGFLALEETVCRSVQAHNSVIATGGSAVYGNAAMAHFREIGKVIYLNVSFEALTKRLHDVKHRGVVLREGQTVEELFAERDPLYADSADFIVTEGDGGIEETVNAVIRLLLD